MKQIRTWMHCCLLIFTQFHQSSSFTLKLLPVNIFPFIIVCARTCQYYCSFIVFKCKQLSWCKHLVTTVHSQYNKSMKIKKASLKCSMLKRISYQNRFLCLVHKKANRYLILLIFFFLFIQILTSAVTQQVAACCMWGGSLFFKL